MPDIGKDFLSVSSIARAEQMAKTATQAQAGEASRDARDIKSLGKGARPTYEGQVDKASRQFEALLLQQMMKSMWDTVPESGLLGGGNEASMYRDMLNEALASSISGGQGIGVRDMVARDMKKIDNDKAK